MLQKPRGQAPNHAANSKNLNLDETSSSALLHELEAFSSNSEQTDLDPDTLIACLEQLDELHPLDASFDTEASLSTFRAQHAEAFPGKKASKRRRTMPRRARWLVAAAAALLLSGSLLAQALDVDLIEVIARWTDANFHFEVKENKQDGIMFGEASDPTHISYPSLPDALAAYGITEQVVPAWIPEGFKLDSNGATATIYDDAITFRAFYEGDSGGIRIEIEQKEDLSTVNSLSIEKDASELHTVDAGGNVHYLFQNNGSRVCAWVNGHLVCMIAGEISESQITKMLESIYQGGQT